MSFSLYWTDEAKVTFDAIVEFVEEVWGEKEAEKFIKRTIKVLSDITVQPYIFKASVSKSVRKGFISRQTSVFYELVSDEIHILWFWDNRQKPVF